MWFDYVNANNTTDSAAHNKVGNWSSYIFACPALGGHQLRVQELWSHCGEDWEDYRGMCETLLTIQLSVLTMNIININHAVAVFCPSRQSVALTAWRFLWATKEHFWLDTST